MAVTRGHGNPRWTEDEVILALDLYFDLKGQVPSEDDPRVHDLSALLRSIPYPATAARKESFRNAAGVVFKLQNLRQVATGKGLGNISKTDKAVWIALGNDPRETKKRANLVRSALSVAHDAGSHFPEEEIFAEGRAATYAHVRRERNRKIRGKLLEQRQKAGPLTCDLCGSSPVLAAHPYVLAAFEAHHVRPIAATGEVKTRIEDMALLCANCHRMIHRAIARFGRWLSIEEARQHIK